MMIVARSYHYREPTRSTRQEKVKKPVKPDEEKSSTDNAVRGFGWRPASFGKTPPETSWRRQAQLSQLLEDQDDDDTTQDTSATMEDKFSALGEDSSAVFNEKSASHRSSPMAVPSQKSGVRYTLHADGQNPKAPHDPNALPTSVAALLAMTTIPRKKFPRQPRPLARRISSNELMEEWKLMGEQDQSPRSNSPTLELLLSPPDDISPLHRTMSYETIDAHSRSGSSESVPSLSFSFDMEDETLSPSSYPTTPDLHRKRRRSERRERLAVSTTSVEHESDHPLNWGSGQEEDDADTASLTSTNSEKPLQQQRFKSTTTSVKPSSFRSNLTASIAAVRSAARSFSNFAAPSILPDDHISRSIFGLPPYRSEMRPKPLDGTPAPEYRRYLNPPPPQHHLIPTDFHLHGSHLDHTDLEAVAVTYGHPKITAPGAVILLETYASSDSVHPGVPPTAPATNTEAGRPPPSAHRREPRENGEFLRVCVLEMNMRRSGKLEMEAPGQARFWLPPREGVCVEKGEDERVGKKVPRRWAGVCVDDV